MQKSKTFKILTIDGGGIKGLYSATIIKLLEEEYGIKFYKKFDMICGTSTGGLIALALSNKIDIDEICNLYKNNAKDIFDKKFLPYLPGLLHKSKYSNKGLKKHLETIFKNSTLGEASNLLCIPSYSVTNSDTVVFKNRVDIERNDAQEDNDLRMVDVALATSAAPTYFPMVNFKYKNKEQYFIDGGVWANNPSMVGLIEAVKYFVDKNDDSKYDNVQILSISSLTKSIKEPGDLNPDRSFIDWRDKLFDVYMHGGSSFNDYFLSNMLGKSIDNSKINYFRIGSFKLTPEEEKKLKMDATEPAVLDMLVSKAHDEYKKVKDDKILKEILHTAQTFNFSEQISDQD